MSNDRRSIERSLEQLRSWLQGRAQSPARDGWEDLSAQIDAALRRIEDLLARGALQEAARELNLLQRRLGVPAGIASPYWRATPSSERPTEPVYRGWDEPMLGVPRRPDEVSWIDQPRNGGYVEPIDAYRGDRSTGAPGRAMAALSQRINRLLAHEEQEVHPEVRWPEEIHAQTSFRVFVSSQKTESAFTGEALKLPRRAGQPLDLEVRVMLPESGALQLRSPDQGVLRIDDNGRSAALGFDLFAVAPGTHILQIALRHGGLERSCLSCEIDVRPSQLSQPEQLSQPAQDAANAPRMEPGYKSTGLGDLPRSEPFSGLLLSVGRTGSTGDKTAYQVVLSGPALGGEVIDEEIVLPSDHQAMLTQLFCELTPALKSDTDPTREIRLRNIGSSLAAKVLPTAIRDVLFDPHWIPGTPLHIECGHLNMPWELLQPVGPRDRPFLGSHFAVTRYPRLGTTRDVIGKGPAVLVAPTSSGLQFADEQRAISRLQGKEPTQLSAADLLLRFLRGDVSCGLLHFCCHGDSTLGQMLGNKLQLDGGFLFPSDVPRPARGQTGAVRGALVFLNACRANNALHTLWGDGGWPEAFLAAGAAVVIAPSWSVSDEGAAEVAARLYQGLRAGLTVGEAMRQVREGLGSLFVRDHLSYAVLGSPNARFVASP